MPDSQSLLLRFLRGNKRYFSCGILQSKKMIRCPWMVTNRKKQHKRNSNAYSLFPTKSVIKKFRKVTKTIAKRNSLPYAVDRRCYHHRVPVGVTLDAVIFTVRSRTVEGLLCVQVVAELKDWLNSFSPWYMGFSSAGIPNRTR